MKVLVRICRTLNYSIDELLEYIPPTEKRKHSLKSYIISDCF
ncbi:MAG: helix-turn-helix domain-containing protein [Lachnospiraceae bacterium]|nr:helix-turn-helix domain-containing protein [Lachnospiraceae bacterium]